MMWCLGAVLLTGGLGAAGWTPGSPKLLQATASPVTAGKASRYAIPTHLPVFTSGTKTIPAGILLRLPAGAEVLWTSPLPRTPRLFLAPPYKAWRWPARLQSGRNIITWQRVIDGTGLFELLGGGTGRLRVTIERREAANSGVAIELRAAVSVAAARQMDQTLAGPQRPRAAADCSSSAAGRATDIRAVRTRLTSSGRTTLTLSARGAKGCYIARFAGAGTYMIQMRARSLAGSYPSLCVWAAPFGPCLFTWYGRARQDWQSVRHIIAVPPNSYLYLYALARPGQLTKVQFTSVHIWQIKLPSRAAFIEESHASSQS